MKFLPKKRLALMMGIFGERVFAGITPTGIERMAEKLLLSDTSPNAHYLIVGSKGIM